ncbi:hypothetical protein ACFE04_024124 [Oxalis oulophora]
MIPLQLPDIEKYSKIPLIGKVHMALSNITINSVEIGSSHVETKDDGVRLVVSDATANMDMNWGYSYKTWVVVISDRGAASVKIEGLKVGIDVSIEERTGALKLSVLNCECDIDDIDINLDGGASWLYQGLVDAFQGKIETAVKRAVTKKVTEGITKLDSLLQSLPKQMELNSVAALNVTFVDDPEFDDDTIEFELDGLFSARDSVLASNNYNIISSDSGFCQSKMAVISLNEDVFNSAGFVYFRANYMHWIVDNSTDLSILNTSDWKDIVPQLYEQYPNSSINLNISVTSPPIIDIVETDIEATMYTDVTINVLDSGKVKSVACISLVIGTSGTAQISNNNLAGRVTLSDFIMSLNWSKIGDLQLNLLQPVMSTVLKTVILPYVNSHLIEGFRLPLPHGFLLHNAEIIRKDSHVKVCSDIAYSRYESPQLSFFAAT